MGWTHYWYRTPDLDAGAFRAARRPGLFPFFCGFG